MWGNLSGISVFTGAQYSVSTVLRHNHRRIHNIYVVYSSMDITKFLSEPGQCINHLTDFTFSVIYIVLPSSTHWTSLPHIKALETTQPSRVKAKSSDIGYTDKWAITVTSFWNGQIRRKVYEYVDVVIVHRKRWIKEFSSGIYSDLCVKTFFGCASDIFEFKS